MKHFLVSNFRFRSAFTLAEVLVTLGIIGIVAALTLPALIANHQKKVIATQIKTNYSLISQAFNRAQAEYGEPYHWPYISYSANPKPDLFAYEKIFKFIQTMPCQQNEKYEKVFDVTDTGSTNYMLHHLYTNQQRYGCYMLKNGAMVFGLNVRREVGEDGNHMITFVLDANGYKGPNKLNKDIHMFYIILHNATDDSRCMSRGCFSMMLSKNDKPGLYGSGHKCLEGIYAYNCSLGCTYRFVVDGFEFKKEYPW